MSKFKKIFFADDFLRFSVVRKAFCAFLYHKKIVSLITLVIVILFLPFDSMAKVEKRPNVVLIVIDALRADHLGCYGYNRDTSPNIDNFARESVLFTKAFSQGPCTHVAVPSLFTSLYPGALHKETDWDVILRREFITLPEILSDYGYTTALVGAPTIKGVYNFKNRFKYQALLPDTPKTTLKDVPVNELQISDMDSQLNERALAWLRANRAKPFFLYIHYRGPHDPYLAPAPYNTIFWKENISDEMKKFIADFTRGEESQDKNPVFEEDKLDFIISQYDGLLRYTDTQVGAVLKELERLGLSENTLVIITADHGDGLFAHGTFFHSDNLYDELIHVPLIMRLPKAQAKNKSVTEIVRHVDIMPTILDMLGIANERIMQGVSLLPLFKGAITPNLNSFSESHSKRLRAIRDDKWSFIGSYDHKSNPLSFELYDIEKDSRQTVNLIKTMPLEKEAREKVRQVSQKFRDELNEYGLTSSKIRQAILGDGSLDEIETIDEETKQALKNLGYIQ
ncbi:MAG: sulfatase [Candidatus Omnitrophota bacterium]|nr:sulfatase [Candidatus Omnitrophota bacterium]